MKLLFRGKILCSDEPKCSRDLTVQSVQSVQETKVFKKLAQNY